MQTAASYERERQQLATLLGSGMFDRAPSLAQLLIYICEKTFEGHANHIKEYNIAVEALGRPPQFDQKKDSIVRVEAHRLRKRLKDYYAGPGAADRVVIEIPPGHYAPRFSTRELAVGTFQYPIPPRTETFRKRAIAGTGIAAVALAITLGGRVWLAPRASANTHMAGYAESIRISAGSSQPYTDRAGQSWEADRFYQGGLAAGSPMHPIRGTRDPGIYQTWREGTFRYDIPVQPGPHEMRLHFAETLFGEGNVAGGGETSRIFNIRANGKLIQEALDVVADAGASTADIRVFKDVHPSPDGYLHLAFEPVIDAPIVSAIEIAPGMAGRLRPIRIMMRDEAYTDRSGQVWLPDRFFRGGRQFLHPGVVSGSSEPEIYRGERFGNLTYSIPLVKGKYALTLHFAETWFGPGKAAQGGAGSRVFDVLANGAGLLRNFDIYREAGGSDRALSLTFRGLEPGPRGKLVVSFVAIRHYACVSAIEVVNESQ